MIGGGAVYKNEVVIKILSRVSEEIPYTNQKSLRIILENVLYDYQVLQAEKALTVLSDIREKMLIYLASRSQDGLSYTTLKGYRYRLCRFANNVHKNVADIDMMDIRRYLAAYQRHVNPKGSTFASEVSGLKAFFSWLENQNYIAKSPLKSIPQPKKEKRMRKPLTPEEFEVLRDTCKTYRERALIECFYSTGGRLAEIEQLDRADINWQELSTNLIGKGDKEREVYITPKAKVHIQKYLLSRTDDCEALFITQRKPYHRLGRRSIQREIAKIGERAGLAKKIFPHLLRHTVATDMLNNGADLITVQEYLGHEDPSSTLIYAKLNKDSIKASHRRCVQ